MLLLVAVTKIWEHRFNNAKKNTVLMEVRNTFIAKTDFGGMDIFGTGRFAFSSCLYAIFRTAVYR